MDFWNFPSADYGVTLWRHIAKTSTLEERTEALSVVFDSRSHITRADQERLLFGSLAGGNSNVADTVDVRRERQRLFDLGSGGLFLCGMLVRLSLGDQCWL